MKAAGKTIHLFCIGLINLNLWTYLHIGNCNLCGFSLFIITLFRADHFLLFQYGHRINYTTMLV